MVNLEQQIRRAQARDLDAFDALTVAYQDMLYATACARLKDRELAQDAAQEALLDAFLSLPKLREPKAFGAWLRKIVFKQCDRLTRQRQPRTLELDDLARLTVDPDHREDRNITEQRNLRLCAGFIFVRLHGGSTYPRLAIVCCVRRSTASLSGFGASACVEGTLLGA